MKFQLTRYLEAPWASVGKPPLLKYVLSYWDQNNSMWNYIGYFNDEVSANAFAKEYYETLKTTEFELKE